MPPVPLNRRRFLGCSAAVGLALAHGKADGSEPSVVRVGLIGLGNRGTALLRGLLEIPGVRIVAVGDPESRYLGRAQGIAEKASRARPDAHLRMADVLERSDVDAVAIALPCDLHADWYVDAIRAGKHLYAEKPLGLSVAECDRVIAEAAGAPRLAVHVGHQRRSNPRYRDGVALVHRGELGTLYEARASWVSSNGPVGGHEGWLGLRDRSGDWMLEQAVHVWDVLHWIKGTPPDRAFGHGRRDVFTAIRPGRDVTDHYTATLTWDDAFVASLVHSWVDPADDAFTGVHQRLIGSEGGLDLQAGTATFRTRNRPRLSLHPGGAPPDTRPALQAFIDAVRSPEPTAPPIDLAAAKEATITGLMVRRAVDERRVVTRDEILTSTDA